MTPYMNHTVLKQFEIVSVDHVTFVIVVVTDAGVVKNKLVHTAAEVSKEEAELLTYVLNQTLTGLSLDQVTAERFDVVRRAAGLTALLAPVAEYIAELIEELGSQKVYLQGASKLLRFPEYHDAARPRRCSITSPTTNIWFLCSGILMALSFLLARKTGKTPFRTLR